MTIKEKLKNLQENIVLANHTTFRIGGAARYFVEARSVEEIEEAVLWAREESVPYFILGGGSNLLVSDEGFEGLVIKVKSLKLKVQSNKIIAEAGVPLAKLVLESVNNNLTGLEWAVGIPGTIGGAVCGNAGAYGQNISQSVKSVKVLDGDGKILDFNEEDCDFSYRGSIFKKNNDLIILEVLLRLENGDKEESQKKIKEILIARKNIIPAFLSSGSFFKNLKLAEQSENFKKMIPAEKIKNGMVPVAYLIEASGLAGKRVGDAQVSEQHKNFIINIGQAKAADVLQLVKICQEKVKEKFGVELEEETRYLR